MRLIMTDDVTGKTRIIENLEHEMHATAIDGASYYSMTPKLRGMLIQAYCELIGHMGPVHVNNPQTTVETNLVETTGKVLEFKNERSS